MAVPARPRLAPACARRPSLPLLAAPKPAKVEPFYSGANKFVPIHPIPRPRQDRCPLFVCQLTSVPKNAISLNHRYLNVFPNS